MRGVLPHLLDGRQCVAWDMQQLRAPTERGGGSGRAAEAQPPPPPRCEGATAHERLRRYPRGGRVGRRRAARGVAQQGGDLHVAITRAAHTLSAARWRSRCALLRSFRHQVKEEKYDDSNGSGAVINDEVYPPGTGGDFHRHRI